MAQAKLSSRQRMINMMYLVLLALVALNIDRKVLKSFHIMEKGFLSSNHSYQQKNDQQMAGFFSMMTKDKKKAKPYYTAAKQAQTISKEFDLYISNLKQEIESLYGGRLLKEEGENGLTSLKNPEGMEKHANLFMVENKGKRAKELQEKINNTRDKLLALVHPNNKLFPDEQEFRLVRSANLLQANEPEGTNQTWASIYLEYQPAGALMALLTQYQNNAKALEAEVINALMTGVNKGDFKIDQMNAAIIPKSNYVMEGENYEAEILLVASNSTSQPKIMANGKMLEDVQNGKAKLEFRVSGVGEKKLSGEVIVNDPITNEPKRYAYEHTYQVFKPVATVSPDKMNLLYTNLDNPLSISVPGFSAADIRVSASSGASISGNNGRYNIKVDGSQKEVQVTVLAAGKNMGTTRFRVRNVPAPAMQLGGIPAQSSYVFKSQLCAQSRILAFLGSDFAYDLNWTVTGYTFIHSPKKGNPTILSVTGSALTPQIKNILCSASAGDKIIIEQAMARDSQYGITRNLNSIILTVR
jgi:gliding motility-associated protein GldM